MEQRITLNWLQLSMFLGILGVGFVSITKEIPMALITIVFILIAAWSDYIEKKKNENK